MNFIKIIAIALLVAGTLGLIYGGFTYTQAEHEAQIGPIKLSMNETKTINVPMWASIAAIAAGGLMLALGRKS